MQKDCLNRSFGLAARLQIIICFFIFLTPRMVHIIVENLLTNWVSRYDIMIIRMLQGARKWSKKLLGMCMAVSDFWMA